MRKEENFTGNPTLKLLFVLMAEDGDTGTYVFSNFYMKVPGKVPCTLSLYEPISSDFQKSLRMEIWCISKIENFTEISALKLYFVCMAEEGDTAECVISSWIRRFPGRYPYAEPISANISRFSKKSQNRDLMHLKDREFHGDSRVRVTLCLHGWGRRYGLVFDLKTAPESWKKSSVITVII